MEKKKEDEGEAAAGASTRRSPLLLLAAGDEEGAGGATMCQPASAAHAAEKTPPTRRPREKSDTPAAYLRILEARYQPLCPEMILHPALEALPRPAVLVTRATSSPSTSEPI